MSGLGNRQYVLAPIAPDPAQYKDEETYAARKANYDKTRAVFDDNIKDGTVTPVYEVCYSGLLSGETKYVFCAPDSEEEPFAGDKIASNNQKISDLKMKLREANDHRNEDFVEKQRAFMETSEYSALNLDLSSVETLVFRALILKRLPQSFKESIGCDEASCGDFRSAGKSVEKNINAIIREYIRTTLSEKSVNFSPELADMLSAIMEDRYAHNVEEISKSLDARYNQSKSGIQAKIDELREENEREKESQEAVAPKDEPKDEAESDDSSDSISNEVPAEIHSVEPTEEVAAETNEEAAGENPIEEEPEDAEETE